MPENAANPDPGSCDRCGRDGAFEFSVGQLCLDCYAEAGTCGAGASDDDSSE